MNEFLETEEKIVRMLKTVYDPEIPVNIYDLGLIYNIDIDAEGFLVIRFSLEPACVKFASIVITGYRRI